MKGGFLISLDSDLYVISAQFLRGRGAVVREDGADGSIAQMTTESGQIFTLYEKIAEESEWEFREGPLTAESKVVIPPMAEVTGCLFECRWEHLVTAIVGDIGRSMRSPVWLLDGDGVMWNSDAIDPARLRL